MSFLYLRVMIFMIFQHKTDNTCFQRICECVACSYRIFLSFFQVNPVKVNAIDICESVHIFFEISELVFHVSIFW